MKPESLILSTALGVFLIIASMALFGDQDDTPINPIALEKRTDFLFKQGNQQQNFDAKQGWNDMQQPMNNNGFQTNQQNPFQDPNSMTLVAVPPADPNAQPVLTAEEQLIAQQDKLNIQLLQTIQLTEAHWQGIEFMELTTEVKQKLNYPLGLSGLLIDEVTLNGVLSGALAGDVLLSIDNEEVDDLLELKNFTKTIRNNRKAKLQIWRNNDIMNIFLRATDFLGVAQVESAPMILAGALMPHPYRGECTNCHLIGTTGHMTPAPDAIILPPPPIARGAQMPHRNFGKCESCHIVN